MNCPCGHRRRDGHQYCTACELRMARDHRASEPRLPTYWPLRVALAVVFVASVFVIFAGLFR